MKMFGSRVEWPGWFSLILPRSWEYEDGGDVITLYDPNGVGAMTISAAHRSRSGEVEADEASELARYIASQRGWVVCSEEIETNVIHGALIAHLSHREADDQWELWEILDRDRAVTVTYVANAVDAAIEREACEEIVRSFTWLPPASRQ